MESGGQTGSGGDAGEESGGQPGATAPEVVAGAIAAESSPTLNEVLTLSQAGIIGICTVLLNKDPDHSEKASLPLLFFYMAAILTLMGLVFKTQLGDFHPFFQNASRILFFCGVAALAILVPRPGYGYAALAITFLAVVGASILLLRGRMRSG